MIRTQAYLTKVQRDGLATLARTTGKKQSVLIREAIDQLIEQSESQRRKAALKRMAGMWKDRDDLPDFRTIRQEWNR